MGSCSDNISRTTMKVFLAVILPFILGALASVNANVATETFSQMIKIGKLKGKCTFSLSYTNTDVSLSESTVDCTKAKKSPKTKSTKQTISPPLTRTRTSLGGTVHRSMVVEGGGTELAIMLVLMAGLRRGVQVVPGRQLGSA